jgi:hypothetical protein
MSKYVKSLLDGLHRANGTYVAHDENVATTFKAGSDSGQLPQGTGNLFKKWDNQ